jgi:hypothetical protein
MGHLATTRFACDMSALAARADIGNTSRQFLEKEVSEIASYTAICVVTAEACLKPTGKD